jgi:spermidine synthase
MRALLCAVVFFSGMAALILESIWFQLAGLAFGSSVWATSIVLGSFMGGMALGNGLAAFKGTAVHHPIRAYAFLELAIAISGGCLVLLFPHLTTICSPLFRLLGSSAVLTNLLRGFLTFALLLVPTTAMGATLPMLMAGVMGQNDHFGKSLGMLYGWNTLGAVFGVIACELLLVRHFGLSGAGGIAAGLNVAVAVAGFVLSRRNLRRPAGASAQPCAPWVPRKAFAARWLASSFVAGFIVLALEVLWHRFFILFFDSYTWTFTVMLAVVLLGISLGGLVSSYWFKRSAGAHHFVFSLAVLSALLITGLYRSFDLVLNHAIALGPQAAVVLCSLFFIFPICLVSGIMFSMFGNILSLAVPSTARATGLLTLFNTAGGMCGALLAGTLAIPWLGIEPSFFALAMLYGAILLLTFPEWRQETPRAALLWAQVGLFIGSLLLFPSQKMVETFSGRAIRICLEQWHEQRVAYREGFNETVQYLRSDLLGEPYYHRLVVNAHSMASTELPSRRYMSLFAYWPMALHPHPSRALLIGFGTGTTARTLVSGSSLSAIEIVDLSRDIIEMSDVIFNPPASNPLRDPRVKVHIEDARFFLQTSLKQYDIITAEPPPPLYKGVTNLYSQEYFQLLHDRLAPGGMVTYWLPVFQMDLPRAKAVARAFRNVFKHSSLWVGNDFNWMLVGLKEPLASVTPKQLNRLWEDDKVRLELRALGFSTPEQIAAMFICGSADLDGWTAGVRPLTDDHPQRLNYSFRLATPAADLVEFGKWMHPARSRERFAGSAQMRRIWPAETLERSAPCFAHRQYIFEMRNGIAPTVVNLDRFVRSKLLNPCISWTLGSNDYAWRIVLQHFENDPEKAFAFLERFPHLSSQMSRNGDRTLAMKAAIAARHIAARAVQENRYLLASRFYTEAALKAPQYSNKEQWTYVRMYLLFHASRRQEAWDAGMEFVNISEEGGALRKKKIDSLWKWLQEN